MAAWIAAIPFDAWPQQRRLSDGLIRPAMVTDPAWFGFGAVAEPIVAALLAYFPGCMAAQRMLSVVMPSHEIPPHRDDQPPAWVCRVHIPLATSPLSAFLVGGRPHHLEPGFAYRVNTEAEHGVINAGDTPRIHFMADIVRGRMRRSQGYACITGPDGIREADTFTCSHDQRIVHVKAGAKAEDLGGLCKICMGLICPHCVGKPCMPWEKQMQQQEARYHALRSYGLA